MDEFVVLYGGKLLKFKRDALNEFLKMIKAQLIKRKAKELELEDKVRYKRQTL